LEFRLLWACLFGWLEPRTPKEKRQFPWVLEVEISSEIRRFGREESDAPKKNLMERTIISVKS
jgi:hypothetical protein